MPLGFEIDLDLPTATGMCRLVSADMTPWKLPSLICAFHAWSRARHAEDRLQVRLWTGLAAWHSLDMCMGCMGCRGCMGCMGCMGVWLTTTPSISSQLKSAFADILRARSARFGVTLVRRTSATPRGFREYGSTDGLREAEGARRLIRFSGYGLHICFTNGLC